MIEAIAPRTGQPEMPSPQDSPTLRPPVRIVEPTITNEYLKDSTSCYKDMLAVRQLSDGQSVMVHPDVLRDTPYGIRWSKETSSDGSHQVINFALSGGWDATAGTLDYGRASGGLEYYLNKRDQGRIVVTGNFLNNTRKGDSEAVQPPVVRNFSGVIAPYEDALCQAIADNEGANVRREVHTKQPVERRFVQNYLDRGYTFIEPEGKPEEWHYLVKDFEPHSALSDSPPVENTFLPNEERPSVSPMQLEDLLIEGNELPSNDSLPYEIAPSGELMQTVQTLLNETHKYNAEVLTYMRSAGPDKPVMIGPKIFYGESGHHTLDLTKAGDTLVESGRVGRIHTHFEVKIPTLIDLGPLLRARNGGERRAELVINDETLYLLLVTSEVNNIDADDIMYEIEDLPMSEVMLESDGYEEAFTQLARRPKDADRSGEDQGQEFEKLVEACKFQGFLRYCHEHGIAVYTAPLQGQHEPILRREVAPSDD